MESDPKGIRARCRDNTFDGPTAGLADAFVQANLMVVPASHAFDFLLFCQRNPKPCPLIEVLEAGRTAPLCAPDADIRTDLPGYRVFKDGILTEQCTDVAKYWTDDLVTFLIGCSFSFERALLDAGIALRHLELQRNVAMYKTTIPCASAGRFAGNMVVSMRPLKARDVARAVEICADFPDVHGAPIHVGEPNAIGIAELACPDFGDPVPIEPGEIPVFWACGVTPQLIAQTSRIPFCITHQPGKMFVTDAPMPGARAHR